MTVIRVRVQPKASENRVAGWRDNVLQVRVTAPPAGGKANAAVISLLSQTLGIAKNRLRITRGRASRDKLIAIEAPDEPELHYRLTPPSENEPTGPLIKGNAGD